MMVFPTSKERDWVFTNMELWTEIRRRVHNGELSKRAPSQQYDLHWDTLKKILEHVEPPGYRQSKPKPRPTIEPFLDALHEILVGVNDLAQGDRQSAQNHSKTVIDTGIMGWDVNSWAKYFASRMDEDQTWPAWIEPQN
jgi:hypothetical protein